MNICKRYMYARCSIVLTMNQNSEVHERTIEQRLYSTVCGGLLPFRLNALNKSILTERYLFIPRFFVLRLDEKEAYGVCCVLLYENCTIQRYKCTGSFADVNFFRFTEINSNYTIQKVDVWSIQYNFASKILTFSLSFPFNISINIHLGPGIYFAVLWSRRKIILNRPQVLVIFQTLIIDN